MAKKTKKKEDDMGKPRIVKSHDVKLDGEYAEWIAEVKHRYRSAQVKAETPTTCWRIASLYKSGAHKTPTTRWRNCETACFGNLEYHVY